MDIQNSTFDETTVLHDLKYYLPAQTPLKDFIHHNTLHAFQHLKFYEALRTASVMFGYNLSLSLQEYRALHTQRQINPVILKKVILQRKPPSQVEAWLKKVLVNDYTNQELPRIGTLRSNWKKQYQIDLDSLVHPILFRILCSYLDQGISIWTFPIRQASFLDAIRDMEQTSFTSFFRTKRARALLLNGHTTLADLLQVLVGDESLYKTYLFDQQFAHQGWSGMVSTVEDQPETLLDPRKLSIHDLIIFELLLEIDALDDHFGTNWPPISQRLPQPPPDLFAPVLPTELSEVLAIWQDAFEWTYYDQVLAGIKMENRTNGIAVQKSFQAMFCIDDREISLRRYLEQFDTACETFGTPGFFGVEFYFQPEHGRFYEKVCPATITPNFLIKELRTDKKREKNVNFTNYSHSFHSGWLISQTLGFWSALRLVLTIFRPTMMPTVASSFRHMTKVSRLTIENQGPDHIENNLQIGFTIDEMGERVENLLKSIGMVTDFAPIVYVVGHGSSSVNNPHYAAYDCGACSGRAGSVNSRVISYMANHPAVRERLRLRGITIPAATQFMGCLHDTSRDEIVFFDEESLSPDNQPRHRSYAATFANALDANAKERSRRFESIDTKLSAGKIHEQVKVRTVSLFEPRPELNHATNALCIVGPRALSKHLFLDRRAFLNSYNYRVDPAGNYLVGILQAAALVCGGINLEYYFSRVDNQKLGAGTKLPHNVMGLFGVANGIDGDLRPGLPSQMVDVHDPIRLLMIVEHFPNVVLNSIQHSAETYEWFINEWINLVVINPETREMQLFKNGSFTTYRPIQHPRAVDDVMPFIETYQGNLPVYLVS